MDTPHLTSFPMSRMPCFRWRHLIALLPFAMSACTSLDAAPVAALEGSQWVLSSLPGDTSPLPATITLAFDKGRAVGTDGCNRYGLPYVLRGDQIEWSGRGMGTQMACEPARMQAAARWQSVLQQTRFVRIQDPQLALVAGDGTVLARLAPQRLELVGSRWTIMAVNNGKAAVSSLLPQTQLSLMLDAQGRVSGTAGCNTYTGQARIEGMTVQFGPLGSTRRLCGDAAVMAQEKAFLDALQAARQARIEGDRLELRDASGALQVDARREP